MRELLGELIRRLVDSALFQTGLCGAWLGGMLLLTVRLAPLHRRLSGRNRPPGDPLGDRSLRFVARGLVVAVLTGLGWGGALQLVAPTYRPSLCYSEIQPPLRLRVGETFRPACVAGTGPIYDPAILSLAGPLAGLPSDQQEFRARQPGRTTLTFACSPGWSPAAIQTYALPIQVVP